MFWITIIFAIITIVIAVILTITQKVFAVKSNPIVDKVDKLLPQTQCGQCGYPGCKPYAEAVVNGDDINKCIPGGQEVVEQLATLLNRPVPEGEMATPEDKIAIIDEERCVGCVKCIVACPVDAIIGTEKLLHVIVPDYCTGCELCVAPCPVKCITMIPHPKEVDKYSAIRREVNLPKSVTPESLIKVVNVPPQNLQASTTYAQEQVEVSARVTDRVTNLSTVGIDTSNNTSSIIDQVVVDHKQPSHPTPPSSLLEILSRTEYDYAPILARKHAMQAQEHAYASISAQDTKESILETSSVTVTADHTVDTRNNVASFVVDKETLTHMPSSTGYTSAFVARLAQKLQDTQSK